MKRHVVDARGFRETGYVYQRDEELSPEEEKAHLAQSEKDVRELERMEASRSRRRETEGAQRAAETADVLTEKGIRSDEDFLS